MNKKSVFLQRKVLKNRLKYNGEREKIGANCLVKYNKNRSFYKADFYLLLLALREKFFRTELKFFTGLKKSVFGFKKSAHLQRKIVKNRYFYKERGEKIGANSTINVVKFLYFTKPIFIFIII